MRTGSSAKKSGKASRSQAAGTSGHDPVPKLEDGDDPDFERGVGVSENGKAYFYSKRRGTPADYGRRVQKAREKYGHLLDKWTLDGYIEEKHREAEREWNSHG